MAHDQPRVMIFPITMKCHSHCRSCGIWKIPRRNKTQASAELLARVLQDPFLARTIESVNISGGEPLSHPGLTDFSLGLISRYPKLREICINTDGHLIDDLEGCLDALLGPCAERGVKLRLYISVDGLGEAHDRHRRHPGAFELAERALVRLAARKALWPATLRVTASFTITDQNTDQIRPVFDHCGKIGVLADYMLAARPEVFIGGAGLDKTFQVSGDLVARVTEAIEAVSAQPGRSNFSAPYYRTMLQAMTAGRRTRGCFFPSSGFVLMPDGSVYICGTYSDFHFGDLTVESFETLWRGEARAACLAEKIPAKCQTCMSSSYEEWDLVDGARV